MSTNKMNSGEPGYIKGASKDAQSITADCLPLQELIEGVKLREVRNIIKNAGGLLTETFRKDWLLDNGTVDQVFQNILNTKQISGWHTHTKTTDRIFVNLGSMKVALLRPWFIKKLDVDHAITLKQP